MEHSDTLPPKPSETFIQEFYRLPDVPSVQVQVIQALLAAFPVREHGFVRGQLELPSSAVFVLPILEVSARMQGAGGDVCLTAIRGRRDNRAHTASVISNPFLLLRRLEFLFSGHFAALEDQADVRQVVSDHVKDGYVGVIHVEQRGPSARSMGSVWFQFSLKEGSIPYVALKSRTTEASAPFQRVLSNFRLMPEDPPEELEQIFK